MPCLSQRSIPANKLWAGFNPLGVRKGIFVLFRGYIDESYGPKQNVFAWSCLIARGKDWSEIERKWKLHLAAKNKELKKAGRPTISRYHASDCSGCRGEFATWTRDERDVFVLKLFGIFKSFPSHTAALDIELDDLCEVFPEWAKDRLDAGYGLLTIFLMNLIGRDFVQFAPDASPKITLFHDRTGGNGKYDPTILRAFNQQIGDPSFQYRDMFTTIAPLSWEQSIALQPADLVAFECFKFAEAKLAARKSRKSFTALVDLEAFGIHYQNFGKKALKKTRQMLEDWKQRTGENVI